jgi:UDP-glucose 4-epimerase
VKNILVTGGAGFIGSHTVVELVKAGYRPVIVDNFINSEKSVLKGLKVITGQDIKVYEHDYQDKAKLAKILKTEKIDGVIHFAAYKAVGESVENPLKYYENNVSGFVTLLETLLNGGVNSFVFSSSAAVYGDPPTSSVTEDTVCNPTSPYGWSKYINEIVLRDTCAAKSELKGIALRYFNVVGSHKSALIGELPKGKPQNLLPIIVQAVAGKIPPLTVYGTDYSTPDGTCLRDYIHVVDLAKAHVAALQKILAAKQGFYEVYNVGTGQPTSVLELIETFEKVNNIKVPRKLGARRVGDPVAYYAVTDKVQEELKWRASKSIADAVADAWRWQAKLSLTTD